MSHRSIAKRIEKLSENAQDRPVDGVFQREPRTLAELAAWESQGYSYVSPADPMKSRWYELAQLALSDPEPMKAGDDMT